MGKKIAVENRVNPNVSHLGLFLNRNNPADKEISDILDSLPAYDNKTAYVKRAILFYNKNCENETVSIKQQTNNDQIMQMLAAMMGQMAFNNPVQNMNVTANETEINKLPSDELVVENDSSVNSSINLELVDFFGED